jgi:hypothetical protein
MGSSRSGDGPACPLGMAEPLIPAARAPKLRKAARDAVKAGYAYVVLDGTLIPVDRVAANRPFYSGKHMKHGMNLQVIACPARYTIRRPSGPGRPGRARGRRAGHPGR